MYKTGKKGVQKKKVSPGKKALVRKGNLGGPSGWGGGCAQERRKKAGEIFYSEGTAGKKEKGNGSLKWGKNCNK